MIMKQFLFSLLGFALLGFVSCKSAKKAYERGDYKDAVYRSLDRLKSSPDNNKASAVFQQAYPALVSYMEDRIAQESLGSSPYRFEKAYDMYQTLNDVYDEVQRTPATKNMLVGVKNYQRELEEVRSKAIKARYRMGEEELASGYREDAIEAHKHFRKVQELDPRYRDIEDKLAEALATATLWVSLPEIPMNSARYEVSSQFFENQVNEFLREAPISPYVRFLHLEKGGARTPSPDHLIRMRFDDFVVGQVYQREVQAERLKDSVQMGSAKVGDSTVYTYGTVKGTLHGFEKEISSSGILNLQIVDAHTDRVLTEKEFAGTFVWWDYWGFVEGDKRALKEDDLKYIDKKRPIPEPDPQTMFVEFTKPIYDQVTQFLDSYYERY